MFARDEQRYEIISVGGRLGHAIRCAFPALRIRARGGGTVVSGVFADQAALYGCSRRSRRSAWS